MRLLSKQAVVLIVLSVAVISAIVWTTGAKQPTSDNAAPGETSSPRAYGGQSTGDRSTGQSPGGLRFSCNEPCHSKRQGIVRMHDATRGTACFECHSANENLMSRGTSTSSSPETIKRSTTDPKCMKCHKTGGLASQSASGSATIKPVEKVDGFFCPACGETVDPSSGKCGKCGGSIVKDGAGWRCSACGPLVDVDEVAKASKEKPSNEVCLLCHRRDDKLKTAHANIARGYKWSDQIANCLGCHKSHNDCGGCHFGSSE